MLRYLYDMALDSLDMWVTHAFYTFLFIFLFPWLLSSRVVGITDDIPTTWRTVIHVPSQSCISRWHTSFHLVCRHNWWYSSYMAHCPPRPLSVLYFSLAHVFPSCFLSSSLPFSCYIHSQHFPFHMSVSVQSSCAALVVPLVCSILMLLLCVSLHIHHSTLISFTSVFPSLSPRLCPIQHRLQFILYTFSVCLCVTTCDIESMWLNLCIPGQVCNETSNLYDNSP